MIDTLPLTNDLEHHINTCLSAYYFGVASAVNSDIKIQELVTDIKSAPL